MVGIVTAGGGRPVALCLAILTGVLAAGLGLPLGRTAVGKVVKIAAGPREGEAYAVGAATCSGPVRVGSVNTESTHASGEPVGSARGSGARPKGAPQLHLR